MTERKIPEPVQSIEQNWDVMYSLLVVLRINFFTCTGGGFSWGPGTVVGENFSDLVTLVINSSPVVLNLLRKTITSGDKFGYNKNTNLQHKNYKAISSR